MAVAPFFNQSDEPTVDGRKFALAYFAELQAVPGFEVVPLGVVEEAIIDAPGRFVARRAKPAGWRKILASMRSSSARSPITRRTIRRAAACASNGTRRTRAFTKSRPATVCRGARRRKNSSRRRWCSKRRWRWPSAAGHANARLRTPPLEPPPTLPPQSAEPRSLPVPPMTRRRRTMPDKDGTAEDADARCTASDPQSAAASAKKRGDSSGVRAASARSGQSPRKSCRRATALSGRCRRRCNRTRLPPMIRPVRSARTARCRRTGRTSAASFRRRRARCDRRAAQRMVRL